MFELFNVPGLYIALQVGHKHFTKYFTNVQLFSLGNIGSVRFMDR